jgi:hypothetical protein
MIAVEPLPRRNIQLNQQFSNDNALDAMKKIAGVGAPREATLQAIGVLR